MQGGNAFLSGERDAARCGGFEMQAGCTRNGIDPTRFFAPSRPGPRVYTAAVIKDAETVADNLVRSTGDRVTSARVHILATLLGADRALTHNEIEARLDPTHEINRVTVYRVLEWLTQRKIAHKIAGEDRVWRFTVQEEGHAGQHPHFVCNGCGRVLCLSESAEPPKPRLPVGFQPQGFELTVKGLCDACGEHSRRRSPRSRKLGSAAGSAA